MRNPTVQAIFDRLGGRNRLAFYFEKTPQALLYWHRAGIPYRYWPRLIRMSRGAITLEDLYRASLKASRDHAADAA
jgi:hypothetical protein